MYKAFLTKSKLQSATKGPPTDLARRTKVTAALLGLVAVGAHARSVGHRKSPLPSPTFPPPRSDRRDACTRTRAALPVTAASGPEDARTVKYVCQTLIFFWGGVSPTQNRVAVQCGAASSVRTSPTPDPEVCARLACGSRIEHCALPRSESERAAAPGAMEPLHETPYEGEAALGGAEGSQARLDEALQEEDSALSQRTARAALELREADGHAAACRARGRHADAVGWQVRAAHKTTEAARRS